MYKLKQQLYNLATDKTRGLCADLIRIFLFLLSIVYGLVVRALILFYRMRPYKLDGKVISVGNITLGGTGKTTLVELIARYLRQQGIKPAILSRGYGSCDEPRMLKMNLKDLPVIVDKDRLRAGQLALHKYGADTLILDDGLQQWRLVKDLEIVTIDAANPFGNGYLMPRGILREGLSALKRADIFVLTKLSSDSDIEKLIARLNRLNPLAMVIESRHKAAGFYNINNPQILIACGSLRGKTAALFCGIGDPDSFENLVKNLGIKVGLSFKFGDHYHYTIEDLDRIMRLSGEKNIDTIITTEKDAVRFLGYQPKALGLNLLVLRIELEITKNAQGFFDRLLKLHSL